jgi:ubiquinone/menaquinone biosynthesis C-methylase UbiE
MGAFGADIQRWLNKWGWADTIMRWRTQDVMRKTQLHRHLPEKGLLLDLGCGVGHIAETIMRDSPARACVMMDPVNSVSPHVSRRLASFSFYPIKGSGTHLPFPDSIFDGVWAAFVLHHVLVDGQQTILNEVRRVLRPGGAFVLLEDTPGNDREAQTTLLADRRLNFEPDEAPHHYRSPAQWRNDLPRHGFSVEREIGFKRVFPAVTFRAVHHRAFVCRRQ